MILVISATVSQLEDLNRCWSFISKREWWERLSDVTEHPADWLKSQVGSNPIRKSCRFDQVEDLADRIGIALLGRMARMHYGHAIIFVTPCLHQHSGIVTTIRGASAANSLAEMEWR